MKKSLPIVLRASALAVIRALQVVSRPAVIYNLSMISSVAMIGTGVTMLCGAAWGLIVLGTLVGVITIANVWMMRRRVG